MVKIIGVENVGASGSVRVFVGQGLDLVVGGGNGQTNSVVLSVEDGVVLAHEHVSHEEHLLGDVH